MRGHPLAHRRCDMGGCLKDMSWDALARPYLSIKGLSTQFGEFVALRDIAFDIEEGEFVCFLGPSGCGKTTLLRTIAGLTRQSSSVRWPASVGTTCLPRRSSSRTA